MFKKMRVLVACEESQAVCKEFRKLGHEAYSCDIIESSGGHPEWHIQGDVTEVLKDKWDMIIAFPPCTHLAVSGAKHFAKKRADGRQREAVEFFMQFVNVDCDKVAIENPVGIISGKYIQEHFPDLAEKHSLPIKMTQKIQPYEYGHEAQKTTGLWLKGLPNIKPTNIVGKGEMHTTPSGKTLPKWYSNCGNRKLNRSKTFPGIAKAMAEQWGQNV
jgi:site-specific DNA-cytosine methylase